MITEAGLELPGWRKPQGEQRPKPVPQPESARTGTQFQPKVFLIIGAHSADQDQTAEWVRDNGGTHRVVSDPIEAMFALANSPAWVLCTQWLRSNQKTSALITWAMTNMDLSPHQVFFFDPVPRHDLADIQNLTMPELREMIKLMAAPDSTAQ